MRNINSLSSTHKVLCRSKFAEKIQQAQHVCEPFSDTDILDLQDAFLNNGLHYIKVNDINSGRALIRLFLNSLNFYHNVAAVTVDSKPLDESATDLYSDLMLGGYLEKDARYKLEEFFLEQFYHDFVWVEAAEELLSNSWATEFFRQMTHFKLDQLIPILIVSYKK